MPEISTWAAAKTYCTGVGASLGGVWRLPSVKELQSILDFSQSKAPMIDPGAFPATVSSSFWSATPVAGTTSAWEVFFDSGITTNIFVTDSSYVRCVR